MTRPRLRPVASLNLGTRGSRADQAQRVEAWREEQATRERVEASGADWDEYVRARSAQRAAQCRLDEVDELIWLAKRFGVWPDQRDRLAAVGVFMRDPTIRRARPARLRASVPARGVETHESWASTSVAPPPAPPPAGMLSHTYPMTMLTRG